MPNTEYDIDATGLLCPEPLMLLRNAVRSMSSGELVSIVATDPSTLRDFTNFCRFMGHDLVKAQCDEQPFLFVIRKN